MILLRIGCWLLSESKLLEVFARSSNCQNPMRKKEGPPPLLGCLERLGSMDSRWVNFTYLYMGYIEVITH